MLGKRVSLYGMTRRLVTWNGQQALHRPFAQVADAVGVVEGTVRRISRTMSPNWSRRCGS